MTATALPRKLGKYNILAEIGRGSFGAVYRACDTYLEREVAIKVLHAGLLVDPIYEERFQREARTLAGLEHPHIITIFEHREACSQPYIAMQLARGEDLAKALQRRRSFSWQETLDILQPVGEALDYAHSQGIVHRDLKPTNIVLDEKAGPLLTDFGLAYLVGEGTPMRGSSQMIFGDPHYTPPEVWEGNAATSASDLYALGCILFEMLTGAKAFDGPHDPAVMRAHFSAPHLPVTWPAGVPAAVKQVLRRALQERPEARYASAGEMTAALRGLDAGISVPSLLPTAAKGGTVPVWQQVGIDMVVIPGGAFHFGAARQMVELPTFRMGRTPVTNAQYAAFVRDTDHRPPFHWRPTGEIPAGKEDHPVVNVNFEDAQAFCQWAGCRLPREMEWEKGACGGQVRTYPWGDLWMWEACNAAVKDLMDTVPVSQHTGGASPYGLLDMAGNVWEWCADLSQAGRPERVLRGGSWLSDLEALQCTSRAGVPPLLRLPNVGFRCCLAGKGDGAPQ
jgi:formylglycine-generating enzyme required for sulfatase activity